MGEPMERIDSALKVLSAWMSEDPTIAPRREYLLVVALEHKAAMRAGFLLGEEMAVVRARDLDALLALNERERELARAARAFAQAVYALEFVETEELIAARDSALAALREAALRSSQ